MAIVVVVSGAVLTCNTLRALLAVLQSAEVEEVLDQVVGLMIRV